MIRCFHEAPKSIFHKVQNMTAGDYALVHLFAEDSKYFNLFKKAVECGRTVILDNSVFELGVSFDPEAYAEWIEALKPTYYIVPDVLENGPATVEKFHEFRKNYPNLPGKVIGVAQGSTKEEFYECYKAIEPYCDMVAISFDYSWFADLATDIENKWERMCVGRQALLTEMDYCDIINKTKPHHLLGIALPQEVEYYKIRQKAGDFMWLYSIDTSNPVVHGLKGIQYTEEGLQNKESQKLYTMINAEVDDETWATIEKNIRMFGGFANE